MDAHTREALSYLFAFSRLTLILVFSFSIIGKQRNFLEFQRAISNFRILPRWTIRMAAHLILFAELAIVILMLAGEHILKFGFLISIVLLGGFSAVIFTVRLRGISTPCNCFGYSEKPVSYFDICRNLGFIACAVAGWSSSAILQENVAYLGFRGWLMIGAAASAFSILSIHYGELIENLNILIWRN